MIPKLNKRGELPPGLHPTTLTEVGQRFAITARRRKLFDGLARVCENLRTAGVPRMYIDGSFVTDKAGPRDVDGCWDVDEHVRVEAIDPVFLDFSHHRRAMKRKYGVDFFVANTIELGSGMPFVGFFQINRDGNPKGILVIELRGDYD